MTCRTIAVQQMPHYAHAAISSTHNMSYVPKHRFIPWYRCLWKKHSFCASPCPAVPQQKLLSSLRFGVLKANAITCLLLRLQRSVFVTDTGIVLQERGLKWYPGYQGHQGKTKTFSCWTKRMRRRPPGSSGSGALRRNNSSNISSNISSSSSSSSNKNK